MKISIEEKRTQVIKELQELAKTEGEPLNSKLHRGLYKRSRKYVGSWREANMQAGLLVSSIRPKTLDDKRKSELLEKFILITLINNKTLTINAISKYANIPTKKATIENIYNYKWNEIIDKLDLERKNENDYLYMNINIFIDKIKEDINHSCTESLINYTFLDAREKVPFIYVISKLSINWNWLNILKKNKFIDCNSRNFKCSQNDLLNILAFKTILKQRQLQPIEINNDKFLPNVVNIMKIFGKSISEILLLAEQQSKEILRLRNEYGK